MPSPRHSPKPGTRPALAGASVLFVFGLLAAASVDPLRLIPVSREAPAERVAVRELTATLAKAVRSLVENASHKPIAYASPVPTRWEPFELIRCSEPSAPSAAPGAAPLLRHALLDLPPPARA